VGPKNELELVGEPTDKCILLRASIMRCATTHREREKEISETNSRK